MRLYLAAFLLASLTAVGCKKTQTIAEQCPALTIRADATHYLYSQMGCAEIVQLHRTDELNGWWYAYIAGTHAEGIFKNRGDMEAWVNAQPFVPLPEGTLTQPHFSEHEK